MDIRSITAPNPGPFTLDGTRTWLVGRSVVLDPGPAIDSHVDAIRAEQLYFRKTYRDRIAESVFLSFGHAWPNGYTTGDSTCFEKCSSYHEILFTHLRDKRFNLGF